MDFEIEFRMIDIKNNNKIQRIEKCEWRYIGCTDRIGHYEFEGK